jgi:hypothetical protein
MNPYRLKNVFEYLTSNNQLLKKKLKLGTSEIPIPPKRDDVTTIEAINRFNKANPRVDTTNLKPLSVKHSNVRQSNVNEPNEGVIQGAYDTATREAQSEGFPAPNYDKFKSRYLKRNMKADGGMLVQPSDDGSRPGYAKDDVTYKGKYETDRYNTVKDVNSLKLNKEKINLKASNFKTGEMRYPDDKGQKYVQQYLDSVQKNYLNNDMSKVTRFKTFIKNKYPKTFAKVIADVNNSGYRGMMDISFDYKRKLANEIITASNNQLKYINQFDIIKKLVPANRAAIVKNQGINTLGNVLDEDTLNSFRKLDKMEDKLSKSLTYIVNNDVKILDPNKIKIKGSAAAGYQTQSPIKKMMNYLAGGGSRLQLNKALEQNKWYQSQNYKVGKIIRNTFDDLSQAYSKDFIGQNFNDAYDYALNRRGSVSVKGMTKAITPERLIWNFAARSADRHFKDLDNPKDWLVKIVDNKGNPIDYANLPVDDKGRRIIDTNKYQFLYDGQTFNKNNLNTKGYQSGLFNDVYKATNKITSYLNTDVPDPDNPKKTISLGELFEKTDGRIFASIGHDDAKGGVKKKPFNTFKILTNVENQALFNAYDNIKSPEVRKKVVNFIYGETKGLRGNKYKQAWIDKNVPFITEYIKTGQGLEQTPYKQGLGKYKIPTSKTAMELSSFPANIPAMYKKLGSVGRKAVGIGTGFLSEKIFFDLDKNNMISKGMSEEEAAAQAMENLTFGLYENKAYMNSLKETAESMGIDSTTFDSAYQLNILNKEFEKNSKNVEEQMAIALENQDVKTSEDLRKNFNIYADRARTEYERLENDISGRISGGSPQIMSNAKNFLTDEQFAKPFYDMQDAAIEKLKREKLNAFDTQKLQSDTAAGDTGNTLLSNVFNMQSLPRAGKFLFDLANPLSPLPKYKDYLSDAEKENQMLRSLEPSDLNLVNLARGFTRDNIRSANVESPILANDIENIKYQNPGVFFSKGGIASLTDTIPPESGPTPHGLPYVYNNVKKI